MSIKTSPVQSRLVAASGLGVGYIGLDVLLFVLEIDLSGFAYWGIMGTSLLTFIGAFILAYLLHRHGKWQSAWLTEGFTLALVMQMGLLMLWRVLVLKG